jgi:hypothetical protein
MVPNGLMTFTRRRISALAATVRISILIIADASILAHGRRGHGLWWLAP